MRTEHDLPAPITSADVYRNRLAMRMDELKTIAAEFEHLFVARPHRLCISATSSTPRPMELQS
jgi:hypothetical protein